MKWSELFSLRISELVLNQLQKEKEIIVHKEAETLRNHISHLITQNFEQETELDREVQAFMDDLEKQGHSFERYKMFPLLKKKLAKQKGIIL